MKKFTPFCLKIYEQELVYFVWSLRSLFFLKILVTDGIFIINGVFQTGIGNGLKK